MSKPSACLYNAAIALGSNLGDRAAHISAGIADIASIEGVRVTRVSTTIETPALIRPNAPEQPPYLNAVILVETSLDPERLMHSLLEIERRNGRERAGNARWQPRTLDLDLLWFDDLTRDAPFLRLPHPELHNRRFVLEPLREVAPDWRHPTLNLSVDQLLANLTP